MLSTLKIVYKIENDLSAEIYIYQHSISTSLYGIEILWINDDYIITNSDCVNICELLKKTFSIEYDFSFYSKLKDKVFILITTLDNLDEKLVGCKRFYSHNRIIFKDNIMTMTKSIDTNYQFYTEYIVGAFCNGTLISYSDIIDRKYPYKCTIIAKELN